MFKAIKEWLFGKEITQAEHVELLNAQLAEELEFPLSKKAKEEWTKRKPTFKKAVKKPVAKKTTKPVAKTPAKKLTAKKVVKKASKAK